MIKENQQLCILGFHCVDISINIGSMALAFWIRFYILAGIYGHIDLAYYMRLLLVIVPAYQLFYHVFRLYEPFRSRPLLSEVERLLKSNLAGVTFILCLNFLMKEVDVSRLVIAIFGVLNTAAATGFRLSLRLFLRAMRRQGYNQKNLLLVGWNEVSGEFYDNVKKNPNLGYQVKGYLSEKVFDLGSRHLTHLGAYSELERLLRDASVDEVVIALDADEWPKLSEILELCDQAGVKASLLPFYLKYLPAKPYIDEFAGMPLINVRRIPLDNLLNSFLKRTFDICASLAGLILLSPLFLGIAIAIRLTSPGPMIYRQQRMGKDKKLFVMYKFRSMNVEDNEGTTTWGTRNDARRTKLGIFLRKYSIDELPQLVNVLLGEMSLVGPRPERPYFVEKFREEVPLYMVKHLVRPGMTGWAQVNGWRGDTSIVERVKCDVYYIENWSFLLDCKILLLTLFRDFKNIQETV